MELTELIKKQEAQSRIALTEEERRLAVAFFMARKAEQSAFRTVNPDKTAEITSASVDLGALREDVAAPCADREAFLSPSPDSDGILLRVPKELAEG